MQILFSIPNNLLVFWDGTRRSKEFHPTPKIRSNTQKVKEFVKKYSLKKKDHTHGFISRRGFLRYVDII